MSAERAMKDKQAVTSRMAFWKGMLEGFSGPLLMSLELKVPVPASTQRGKKLLVKGLNRPPSVASESTNTRLAQAMRSASARMLEKHGLVNAIVLESKTDSTGKKRTYRRYRVRRKKSDVGPAESS